MYIIIIIINHRILYNIHIAFFQLLSFLFKLRFLFVLFLFNLQ